MAAVSRSVPRGRGALTAAAAVACRPDGSSSRLPADTEIWAASSAAAAYTITSVVIGAAF